MSAPSSRVDRLAARWPTTRRDRGATAGLAFGAVGALVALLVAGSWAATGAATGEPRTLFGVLAGLPVAAGLGAAAVGGSLWWRVVEVPGTPSSVRGGLVGAAVGVLAHPVMWLLFGLGTQVVDPAWIGDSVGVLGALGDLFFAYAVTSLVSVLAGGVVTVPVAVATGVGLARLRQRAPAVVGRRPRDHH